MMPNLKNIFFLFLGLLTLLDQAVAQSSKNQDEGRGLGAIVSDSFLKSPKVTSIMYSDEEITNIERALDSYKNNEVFTINNKENEKSKVVKKENEEKSEDNAKSYVYLNSIIYFEPNNWMIWINGKKISINDNKPTNELYVRSIDKDEAVIVWTMGVSKWKILSGKKSEDGAPINNNNQAEVVFTIKVGQTYVLRTGKIVEGKIS